MRFFLWLMPLECAGSWVEMLRRWPRGGGDTEEAGGGAWLPPSLCDFEVSSLSCFLSSLSPWPPSPPPLPATAAADLR